MLHWTRLYNKHATLYLSAESTDSLLDRHLTGIRMGHQPKKTAKVAHADNITISVTTEAEIPKQENCYRSMDG